MKEFIDKLIERFEKQKEESKKLWKKYGLKDDFGKMFAFEDSIKIVKEFAKEYNKRYEPTMDLIEYGVDGYNLHLKEQYKKGYADAKKENGWIPCSERLPEEDRYVLVTRNDGSMCVAKHIGKTLIGIIECEWKMCGAYLIETDVIAWQPLPAPYTEGE